MAHRHVSSLVFSGFTPTTAATLISLLGDEGMPGDIRIVERILYQPWHSSRSGLLLLGMDPSTDLAKVSMLIEDRTTWWEVAICLKESIQTYQPALLAQGAIKVLPHPEDDLTGSRDELRELLQVMTVVGTDLLGLELSDLIQLYAEKRAAKTIRISGDGVIGSMFLRDGLLVHAETMDDDEGMAAFSRLFRVQSPEMRVHNGCLTTKSSMNMPAMTALLEGARVNDEGSRASDPGERSSKKVKRPKTKAKETESLSDDLDLDFDAPGEPVAAADHPMTLDEDLDL